MNSMVPMLYEARDDQLHFADDVLLTDFTWTRSLDSQCLLIHCRDQLVVCCTAVGCEVEGFVLAGGKRYSIEEILVSIR